MKFVLSELLLQKFLYIILAITTRLSNTSLDILIETFPRIFNNFPPDLHEHSPNVKSITFPGILVNIPRVLCIPRIPFPAPIFLVL